MVLPNAWDAATAKAVAAAGFPAVATTRGGLAAALGYEDHKRGPAGEMLAAAARITRSVGVPVAVDAEAGYGTAAAELAPPHGPDAAPSRPAGGVAACVRQAASDQDYRLPQAPSLAELAELGWPGSATPACCITA